MDAKQLLLAASIVMTGMVGGLFYGWVVSVIPGTRRISDAEYVNVMQHVNREILTPRFLVPFMITPLLLGAAAFTQFRAGDQRRGVLIALSAVTYAIGVFGVTAAGNVPLNDELEDFVLSDATPAELAERRATYEGPWNRWNQVRTTANLVAFGLVVGAAVIDPELD